MPPVFPILRSRRLARRRAGWRSDPCLAVSARRLAGQASQEKEQVLDKFRRIGNRQVTAHHQAGDARQSHRDDGTTVTNTLEEFVAEEGADHTAKTIG